MFSRSVLPVIDATIHNINLIIQLQEPPRPPTPPPTFATYTRNTFSDLKIRLVGSHPLWAHHLYCYSDYVPTGRH
jgi:nicotinamide N-methyltransferase